MVPWWSAALCLRLALAAAPRWRRRARPGTGCKGGGAVAEGGDTISSLSLVLPSEVVAVRVACPPASFTKISSSPLHSSPFLCQESELNVLNLSSLVLEVLTLWWSELKIYLNLMYLHKFFIQGALNKNGGSGNAQETRKQVVCNTTVNTAILF